MDRKRRFGEKEIADGDEAPPEKEAQDEAPAAPETVHANSNYLVDNGDPFGHFTGPARAAIHNALVGVETEAAKLVDEGREVNLAITIRRTRTGQLSAVIAGAGVTPTTIDAAG